MLPQGLRAEGHPGLFTQRAQGRRATQGGLTGLRAEGQPGLLTGSHLRGRASGSRGLALPSAPWSGVSAGPAPSLIRRLDFLSEWEQGNNRAIQGQHLCSGWRCGSYPGVWEPRRAEVRAPWTHTGKGRRQAARPSPFCPSHHSCPPHAPPCPQRLTGEPPPRGFWEAEGTGELGALTVSGQCPRTLSGPCPSRPAKGTAPGSTL